jgi:hypothetical protein
MHGSDAILAIVEILDQSLEVGNLHVGYEEYIRNSIRLKGLDILHQDPGPPSEVVAKGAVDFLSPV